MCSSSCAISVQNCPRVPPEAPVSDDQQMQLWTLSPTALTWLACPLLTNLDICGQAPLRALHAYRTIHLYPSYIPICMVHTVESSDLPEALHERLILVRSGQSVSGVLAKSMLSVIKYASVEHLRPELRPMRGGSSELKSHRVISSQPTLGSKFTSQIDVQ